MLLKMNYISWSSKKAEATEAAGFLDKRIAVVAAFPRCFFRFCLLFPFLISIPIPILIHVPSIIRFWAFPIPCWFGSCFWSCFLLRCCLLLCSCFLLGCCLLLGSCLFGL